MNVILYGAGDLGGNYLHLGKDNCFTHDIWNGGCEKLDIE